MNTKNAEYKPPIGAILFQEFTSRSRYVKYVPIIAKALGSVSLAVYVGYLIAHDSCDSSTPEECFEQSGLPIKDHSAVIKKLHNLGLLLSETNSGGKTCLRLNEDALIEVVTNYLEKMDSAV